MPSRIWTDAREQACLIGLTGFTRQGQPKGAGNDFNALQGIDTMTRTSSTMLALQTRAIARGRDVLYHGTRYRESILASGLLALSNSGGVYFTRDVETAVHWATLTRDDEDEGAILVLDRPSLKARYRLELFSYAEGRMSSRRSYGIAT